ncbi:MAG TPA: 30S ribosomal protein S4 [Blattabacteriaceae bacterium]
MAKYIGPRGKIERKFGEPLYGKTKAFSRKKYPPGQHGLNRKKIGIVKRSEYSIQLSEKQKVKHIYGILERQFFNMFEKASKKKGVTGELLLQSCESRLDNVVYRLGLAPSRASARQLVSHRHIMVDDRIVNIPSYSLKPRDTIKVREKSKKHPIIHKSLSMRTHPINDWLFWDSKKMTGIFQSIPRREQIPENIKEQLIVELFSK